LLICDSIWFSNFFKHFWSIVYKFKYLLFFLNIWLPLILIRELGNIIKFIDLVIRWIKETINRSFNTKHYVKHKIKLITPKSNIICTFCMFLFLFFLRILLPSTSNSISMMNVLNYIWNLVFSFRRTSGIHGRGNQIFKVFDSLEKSSYW